VTVYIGAGEVEEACSAARLAASSFAPIELHPEKLDSTPIFTKTLFIQFGKSSTASELSKTLRSKMLAPSDYELNPHLSLMYKNIHEIERLNLCQTLHVPQSSYVFDTLSVIRSGPQPILEEEQIRRWIHVHSYELGNRGQHGHSAPLQLVPPSRPRHA
jgi:hypothetical protein